MEQNLFNWYKFKENSTLLEIEPFSNNITNYLSQKVNTTVKKIDELNQDDKYDYVVIYKVDYLSYAQKVVASNGTILIVTNNRFGISYWAGGAYNGRVYSTIENDKSELYSRKEIIELLENSNLKNYKFYYPLPNYKNANVIFSDEYLPKENDTKISYNINYDNNSVVVFDEIKVLKQLIKNNMFQDFANSFFIEISLVNKFDEAKFISFNNSRKDKYCLSTVIYKDVVEKRSITEASKEHILSIKKNIENLNLLNFNIIDKEENNVIISKYTNADTLDKILVELIKSGKENLALDIISKWYDYIKERLINNKKSDINENINLDGIDVQGLTVLKNGYIDLVFENTFYIEDKFLFFDQEWYLDGMPLEFILYRAINNIYIYNGEIENILSKNDIFLKFGLNQYIELFERIELYFQNEIRDEEKTTYNNKSISALKDINELGILFQQIDDYKENDAKQNKCIKDLEEDNRKKQEYINILENQVKELNKGLLKRFFNKGENRK